MARMIDADLLKQHYAWWGSQDINSELKEYKTMFDQIVDAQPTATQVGQWIVYEVANIDEEPPIAWKCNNCGEVVEHKWNFCPNCGAKMERRQK